MGWLSAVHRVCWQWESFVCQWTAGSSTDWSEKAAGLNFHLIFLGQQRLGINSQNWGSVLFILTCEWVRVYSQIQDSHTQAHTWTCMRMCMCTGIVVAFLSVSCRGGSAHSHWWLSNLINWWTLAPRLSVLRSSTVYNYGIIILYFNHGLK